MNQPLQHTVGSSEPADQEAESSAAMALASRVIEEMSECWQRGERPIAEQFLERYPQLAEQPEAALELVYEEVCLRREYGLAADSSEILRRFPQWHEQLSVMLECDRILEGGAAEPRFPMPGEHCGEFAIQKELGRGASGRVFLATQPHLGNRAVVLKLTRSAGQEHISLARLQHTHIVPLYASHDDPACRLRVLCMPYFGGTTLARVLEALRGQPLGSRTGQDILDVIGQDQPVAQATLPPRGPTWQFFAHATYVQAICWIGACLADALQYAHERGLLHLDLKPSNVLLVSDGQPMLLDFHLARASVQAGTPAPDWLGGTVGYMSPEQQLALAAVPARRESPVTVDARSDVYSLGVLLYESLGGTVPGRAGEAAVPLDQRNPQVSRGLADIVARCLACSPEARYATAGALGADLRRHLTDLPLREVPNRSLGERWHKWRRRRPYALWTANLVLALVIAVAAVAALLAANFSRHVNGARAALAEGINHLGNHQFAHAVDALKRGLAMTRRIPAHGELKEALSRELSRAERAQAARDLHRLADQLRFLFAAELAPSQNVSILETRCRSVWENRARIRSLLEAEPGDQMGDQIRTDLLDLAILLADLHTRVAPSDDSTTACREAIELLNEAEREFGPSPVLSLERASYQELLAPGPTAAGVAENAVERAPHSAWEYYAIGRAMLKRNRLDEAAERLEKAVELQPESLWPNFYLGTCNYRRGRFEDAVVAFTACIAAAPEPAGCFYNRALAYTALGRTAKALSDYGHALKHEPTLAVAALNRAILYYESHEYDRASADLETALTNGANPATVHYNLAIVRLAQGDRAAAMREAQMAADLDHSHSDARALLLRLKPEK